MVKFIYRCDKCGEQAKKPPASKEGLGKFRCPQHGPVKVKRERLP